MKQEEKSFSQKLRQKAFITGKEWGWKFEVIPQVVSECKKLDYALLGGQARFSFPGATCELYWLRADPKEWDTRDRWSDYAQNSCSEFLVMYDKLIKGTDFLIEGINSFKHLENMNLEGINILEGLCFMMYPVSEERYLNHRYYDLGMSKATSKQKSSIDKPLKYQSAKIKHQAFCRGWITWSWKTYLKSFFSWKD
jgi:hypothetical protein